MSKITFILLTILLISCKNKEKTSTTSNNESDADTLVVLSQKEMGTLSEQRNRTIIGQWIISNTTYFTIYEEDGRFYRDDMTNGVFERSPQELICSKINGKIIFRYKEEDPTWGERYEIRDNSVYIINVDGTGGMELNRVGTYNLQKCNGEPSNNTVTDAFNDYSSWKKNTDYLFKYPSILVERVHESNEGNELDYVTTYEYNDIQVFLYGSLGNWTTYQYPNEGDQLSYSCHIEKITYTNKNGVISGYVKDGRIFYMKHLVDKDADIPHSYILGIIYPREQQETVAKMIKEISKWKLPYAE